MRVNPLLAQLHGVTTPAADPVSAAAAAQRPRGMPEDASDGAGVTLGDEEAEGALPQGRPLDRQTVNLLALDDDDDSDSCSETSAAAHEALGLLDM